MDIKSKGLRETIGLMTEELGATHESMKASEEWVVDLEKIAIVLHEDLSSTQEKSSKVDELKEEWAKLIARCSELEEAVRRKAKHVYEVPPEVMKKVKDDYLALEEFQEEKFECAMDGHS